MSPSPEQLEYAALLLRRAEADLYACRVLAADPAAGDDSVGFHAQQAAEKALKLALVLAGSDFPRTHDLEFLVARVRDCGVEPPVQLTEPEWLTPWAAEFRYDEPMTLDRGAAVAAAASAVEWAASLMGGEAEEDGG